MPYKRKTPGGKPARPATAYAQFNKVKAPELMNASGGQAKLFRDVGKEVAGLWKNLTPEEKAPYLALHAKAKEQWEEQMKEFMAKKERVANLAPQADAPQAGGQAREGHGDGRGAGRGGTGPGAGVPVGEGHGAGEAQGEAGEGQGGRSQG